MTKQKAVNDTFLKNTFSHTNLQTKSTSYGHVNEKNAKKMYINKTKSHLHDIGLVVNPAFQFLGASPNAVVCNGSESSILEVKCPYSARDLTIMEAAENIKGFCLENKSGNVKLMKNYKQYYQVQGQLLITDAPYCNFVVYIRHDLYIKRVMPDESMMLSMLEKLLSFYIDYFKPFVALKKE